MNLSNDFQPRIRNLFGLVAALVALSVGSVACGAAPDGDPANEPASKSVGGDQTRDGADGGAAIANPPSQGWVAAEPTASPPGGGPGAHPSHPVLQQ